MKQFSLLLLSFLLLTTSLFSQFNSGDKFLSGSTSLSTGFRSERDKADSYTSDATNHFAFSLNTSGGFFLRQRFALGALVSLSHDGSKYNDEKDIYNSFMLGPVVRYYRGTYQGISPFAQGIVAFGTDKSKSVYTEGTYESKHKILRLAAGLGANYFFTETVALEGLLQYAFTNRTPTGDNPGNNHHTSGGLNLSFGVTVYFSSL